ncbi:hypothetical protein IC744_14055 [Microbacterium hominis]|uniref:hypothetical protein n=1 Tax=Microbacterium TaxID=33882 RepID=UPI00168B981B|nr:MULTISPECIES: hypothetical protein [Microbacterium]QOC24404.1 hypothetical protein IC745_08295 [Microbacterium hominis]QOC28482.1 hypothetical protein IC744_14055 [Microbacterium hominis]QYF96315.1 hypothetical protein KY498_08850 [Microbacterium sp. PAMC21962]
MSDLAAVIDSVSEAGTAILVALIGAGVLSTRRRVKRVLSQVENDHSTNLREEADERHNENTTTLRTIVRDIGGIRGDIRALRDDLTHERDRIDDLEDTINPTKEKP